VQIRNLTSPSLKACRLALRSCIDRIPASTQQEKGFSFPFSTLPEKRLPPFYIYTQEERTVRSKSAIKLTYQRALKPTVVKNGKQGSAHLPPPKFTRNCSKRSQSRFVRQKIMHCSILYFSISSTNTRGFNLNHSNNSRNKTHHL